MNHKPLDKTGIWLAIVCALHCLLVPVLLPTLSLLGLSFLGWEVLERVVLSFSLVIGAAAILIGMRHHQSFIPLLLLLVGGVFYVQKNHFGHGFEPVMVLAGAALIVTAHVINLQLCRVRKVKDCDAVDEVAEMPDTAASVDPARRSA